MWENCLLGRKEEAHKLERYLERKQAELRKTPESRRGHTLNIDAKWGEGKTTFIECWHNQLSQNHLVIRFDAWKTDFFGDPLVAFVGTFDKQISDSKILTGKKGLQDKIKKPMSIIKNAVPLIAEIAARRLFRMGSKEIVGLLSEDSGGVEDDGDSSAIEAEKFIEDSANAILDIFNKKVASVDAVLKSLNEIVGLVDEDNDLHLPIYIFIDELDRCRPTYAIEVLEIIKHIFSASGVQFIVATDTDQLEHTVKSVYGSGFDAKRYLRRFFDDRYTFPESDYGPIFEKLISSDQSDLVSLVFLPEVWSTNTLTERAPFSQFLHCFSIFFGWSVRDQIQVYDEIKRIILFNFTAKRRCHIVLLTLFVALRRSLDDRDYEYVSASRSLIEMTKRYREKTENSNNVPLSTDSEFFVRKFTNGGSKIAMIPLQGLIESYLNFIGLNNEMLHNRGSRLSFSFEEDVLHDALKIIENNDQNLKFEKYTKLAASFGGYL